VTFTWSGTDDITPVSELQYYFSLDGEGVAVAIRQDSLPPDPSPTEVRFDSLAPGLHVFSVRARDGGNDWDRTPDVRRFTVLPSGTDLEPSASAFAIRSLNPNPTRASVVIAFDLDQPGDVRATLFDIQGRTIKVIEAGRLEPGYREITWDGRTETSQRAPSGVYYLRLDVSGRSITRQLTVAR
jgi:hypothetical protein